MIQSRLNDAAIMLSKILTEAGIKHGVFGGFAITVLGGPRESKDVDCLASANKEQIVALLTSSNGFTFIPQPSPDYAAFLWSAKPEDKGNVLVELFVDTFKGSEVQMANIHPIIRSIEGQTLGNGNVSFLDPVHIFKGKLRACAEREKPHDAADLRWLEGKYRSDLQQKNHEFSLIWAGLALKRSPELEYPFIRIGLDVEGAKVRVAAIDLDQIAAPQPGDVQKGLLALP